MSDLETIVIPTGWTRLDHRGPAPFVTAARFRRADGTIVTWDSRRHRKQRNRLGRGGSTWWAPHAVAWWIAVLFMVGSACFALGALPGYLGWAGPTADGVTFFVGSIFFTSAALLQYLEVGNAERAIDGDGHRERVRLLTWSPRRIDWWAASVQLVGTVFFNVNTFRALQTSMSAADVNQEVWRPDALGCICFLVSSWLAWAEVGHRWVSWQPRRLSWWIAALNLVGSIAFGVSAIASYVVPDTAEPRNAAIMNLGTFVGGLCFLAGAALLLPERTAAPTAD